MQGKKGGERGAVPTLKGVVAPDSNKISNRSWICLLKISIERQLCMGWKRHEIKEFPRKWLRTFRGLCTPLIRMRNDNDRILTVNAA